MKNIYIDSGIVQKIISKETYDIMKICKSYGNYNDIIEAIQEYILNVYGNVKYYNDVDLYNYLLNIIFDLFDEQKLKNILKSGINDCFKNKMLDNRFIHTPIDYHDLILMLINSICLMQVRTEVDNDYIDLYLIEDNGVVLSIEEYNRMIIKKSLNN